MFYQFLSFFREELIFLLSSRKVLLFDCIGCFFNVLLPAFREEIKYPTSWSVFFCPESDLFLVFSLLLVLLVFLSIYTYLACMQMPLSSKLRYYKLSGAFGDYERFHKIFFCKESHLICSSFACFYHIFQCAHAVQPAYKSSSQYTGSTWFIWWETQIFPIRKVTVLSSMFLPSNLFRYLSISQDFPPQGSDLVYCCRACYYKCFFHLLHTCRQPARTRPGFPHQESYSFL